MSRTRRSTSRRAPETAAGERALGALALALAVAGCAARTSFAPDAGAPTDTDAGSDAGYVPFVLPPIPADGYSMVADDVGGYQLGGEIPAAQIQSTLPATSSTTCDRLRGVVRDFKGALPAVGGSLEPGGHPDFEVFEGKGVTPGLVAPDLDTVDRKPRYASKCELGAPVSPVCPYGAMTTTKANFDQWYRSVEDVNRTFFVYFKLAPPDPDRGVSTFSSMHFFPLDDAGFGDSGVDPSTGPHNYSFTTEIHTTFRYNGHEVFQFDGDDDVWIFVDGKLAVDLGGVHEEAQGSIDLDQQAAALGLTKGSVYPLDLFHAERHSVKSDFRIDMNFAFQDCGYIVP